MKTKMRGLALTAMLLSGSSMVVANDGTSVVGDLPGYGEEAYFGEDAAYTENHYPEDQQAEDQHADESYADDQNYGDQGVQPVSHIERASGRTTQNARQRSVMRQASTRINRQYAPVSANAMQPVSHQSAGSPCGGGCGDAGCSGGCDTGGCDAGYDMGCGAEMSCGCGSSGCDGGSCGSHRRMFSLFKRCDSNTWASMDALLWFVQDRDTPPLILTSDPGSLPFLPEDNGPNPDNVQTVFGNDIQSDMTVGFRADAGKWLSDNVGVGGRFWALSEADDSYAFSGNGNGQSVGRSFYNSSFGFEDSLPIAITGNAGGPDLVGSISAESTLDIWAAEAYARLRFGCSKSCQLDFIGGYSHFDIDDSLRIDSTTVIAGTGAAPPLGSAVGDQLSYYDRFDTDNTFDGGQLGFEMVMNRGRWMARSLTKVHLGNMNQALNIRGSSALTPVGGATTTAPGGVLAGNNATSVERDVFAFAPEANFKLAYRFRPNVLLSVGYSFIYWDNVARTGDVIDRIVDGTTIGTGTNGNGYHADDSSLWVQGIDLGVVIDF